MELLELVKEFAKATEAAIGTENTETLLVSLTTFAKTCPGTMQELTVLVEENPEIFANLLTPEGVVEAKAMVDQIMVYAPMFSAFK